MLNPKTNERELAYIVHVTEAKELPGYDHVHYVKILGWWCVASKELKAGDLGIYFEIDSILPRDDARFSFMEKRNYRVKTMKMCKVVSQGLVLPLTSFPELHKAKEGDFVTKKLRVMQWEDRSPAEMPRPKSDAWTKAQDRHKRFFKNPVVKFFMRFVAFRWIAKKIFCKKKDRIKWPEWLPKTNSERVQNVPDLFSHPEVKWVASEKVDGMSSSFILDEKDAYMVASHNVIVFSDKVKGSENIADGNAYIASNVWLEMSEKYDVKTKLHQLKKKYRLKTVAIQGETYGDKIQRRAYGLRTNAHDLAVFHIWFDGHRLDMKRTVEICDEIELPHVHIFDWEMHMPVTVEELIAKVDSCKSAIDGGMIEGFVLYSQDGMMNFKCVSPSFLLKYHG